MRKGVKAEKTCRCFRKLEEYAKESKQMETQKRKFALWIRAETMETIEALYKKDNCRSRSEFIEKAVLFYSGYLRAEETEGYLPAVVISAMQGSLGRYEDRTARLLFKMAVELSMLIHTVAATNEIEEESLSRLRGMCVREVKNLKGSVTLEDAAAFQRGDTDG